MVDTESGRALHRPFVVAAAGILSVPVEPDIPGMTASPAPRCSPADGRARKSTCPVAGRVIGAGSTAVQLIPVIAPDVPRNSSRSSDRRPTRCLVGSGALESGELDEMKAHYGEIGPPSASPVGAARLSAFSVLIEMLELPLPIKVGHRRGAAAGGRRARHHRGTRLGRHLLRHRCQPDGTELYGGRSPGSSTTPDRRPWCPATPLAANADHRPGLHETFNRDNVTLVDLRSDPIRAVTTTGIDTEHHHHDLDA